MTQRGSDVTLERSCSAKEAIVKCRRVSSPAIAAVSCLWRRTAEKAMVMDAHDSMEVSQKMEIGRECSTMT